MNKKEYIELLENKGAEYVWQFVKQTGSFEHAFNAVKLFEDWRYFTNKQVSLSDFYKEKFKLFDLGQNNYRSIIIAQLFGLISKYGDGYKKQNITEIYNNIATSSSVKEFSTIITEQLLKVRINAITDKSYPRIDGRFIYPVIYIYQVLNKLPNKSISRRDLFSFVMTMNSHLDVDLSVKYILDKTKIRISDDLFKDYKDRSRIETILKNIQLFIFEENKISLNRNYTKQMDGFLSKFDFFKKDIYINNINEYKDFLTHKQNFNICLKDYLSIDLNSINSPISNNEDNDYVQKSNNIELNDDDQIKIDTAHEVEPEDQAFISKKPSRNPKIGRLALSKSNYMCEFDNAHVTFISRVSKENYVEAHHLIPINQQIYYWKKCKKNIDCIQNIVSLCPTCHRAVHYGTLEKKQQILEVLFTNRSNSLNSIGIKITETKLNSFYF